MFCTECGTPIPDGQTVCPKCGASLEGRTAGQKPPAPSPSSNPYDSAKAVPADVVYNKNRVTAGVLGIILGGFGAHKFYLGYTTAGIIMLAVWFVGLFTIFPLSGAVWVLGLVEGIIYLTKSDAEFYDIYVAHTREWF